MKTFKIYIDDIRTPPNDSWIAVKSAEEFKKQVLSATVPITIISIDHDLGEGMLDGYDITKWVVEYAMDNKEIGENLKTVIVHSDNTPGRENIASYFENAKTYGIFNKELIVKCSPAMLVAMSCNKYNK